MAKAHCYSGSLSTLIRPATQKQVPSYYDTLCRTVPLQVPCRIRRLQRIQYHLRHDLLSIKIISRPAFHIFSHCVSSRRQRSQRNCGGPPPADHPEEIIEVLHGQQGAPVITTTRIC
ncbi:hypothetical protein C8Q79DRAFT_184213 [Trametes meyenii]|nr:hypothetical protein C8Q79DRAFT_184213 [Trametes meyenii]